MKIKNVSPLGGVMVPLLGREVEEGAEVEVSVDDAGQLLAQPLHWAPADDEARELLEEPAAPEPDDNDAGVTGEDDDDEGEAVQ